MAPSRPDHPSRLERTAVCALLTELGPDAPSGCDGWTTRDLAAHLVVRDRRIDTLPGLVAGGPFARWTERVRVGAARRPYDALVDDLRSGPPWRGPGGINPVGDLHEFVVHHEDIRRADGRPPRTGEADLQRAVWGILERPWGRILTRRAPVGVTLTTTTGDDHVARAADDGEGSVVLTGEPIELLLRLFDRTAIASVTIEGDPADVAAFEAARIGL